jgi:hypothetical protein
MSNTIIYCNNQVLCAENNYKYYTFIWLAAEWIYFHQHCHKHVSNALHYDIRLIMKSPGNKKFLAPL